MNRMSLTNFRWITSLGKSCLLMLVALFMAGTQANAQVKISYDAKGKNTCETLKFDACSGDVTSSSTLFIDDGENDGNYNDSRARIDSAEICPTDKWHYVKVVFTKFDLAAGDTLELYDGDKKAVRGGLMRTSSGSGTGVSKAFGGWVDASCDPAVNTSGCLTFILRTNGDNNKGSGWDAWVDCAKRDIEIKKVAISDVKLSCDDDPYATITIPAPDVTGCSPQVINDSVRAIIRNQHGNECANVMLSESGLGGFPTSYTGVFAIGNYSVTFELKSDPTKKSTQYFSVQAPSLVCNDDINVPLGSACMVVLSEDDVLESPCDTTAYLQYKMKITIPGAHGFKDVIKEGTSYGGYPIITQNDVKKAGLSVCEAKAKVEVTRVYYGDRDGDGNPDIPMAVDCDNGTKYSSCSTGLDFSDEVAPWITVEAKADTLVACDADGLDKILKATAFDNCDDELTVEYKIDISEKDPCFREKGDADTTTAVVTFTSIDDCGNVGTKTKKYTIIRPNQFAKTENVTASCDEDVAETGYPGLKIGYIKNGIFKVSDTVHLNTEDYICGYILTKKDIKIPATDCGEKLFRYWSVVDWCNPEIGPSAVDTTFIEYLDTKAPKFVGEEKDQVLASADIELGHFDCTYDINKHPRPSATDNCDADVEVSLHKVFRIEDGKNWEIDPSYWSKLDCDSFRLMFVARDDCHEQLLEDTTRQIVVIKDVTKPTAVCTDQLNITISNPWGARIHVDDIDAGSYDACGVKKREIRVKGKDLPWAEYVDIGCEYVHPDLQIEMRVTDKKGNYNICWSDIIVEDKIPPVCYDLEDKERYCDEFHNGELGASTDADGDRKFEDSEWTPLTGELLAVYEKYFGTFKCEDNLNSEVCGNLTTYEEYQLIEWPCGEVDIRRRTRSEDWSQLKSNYAHQSIKIVARANWKFTVPDDWNGECNDDIPAGEISINNGACDLLGYEVTEKLFEIPGDACWKLERTYHIINWCKYTAGADPVELARVEGEHGYAKGFMVTSEGNEDKGYFTYVQVLKIHDDEGPVVTVVDPEPCISGIDFDAEPYGEEDITPNAAPYECDEVKTWTASATDCSDQSAITWEGRLYDGSGNLVRTVYTNTLSYVVGNKEAYYAEFWAYDGCGNSGGAKGATLKFWDCKKPTPYAINGVAVELMETGMIQIWATDVDRGSFDNCTDQSKLDLRIWHSTLANSTGSAPAVYLHQLMMW